MLSDIIDLTHEAPLPEDIRQDWLPLDGQSVPHLFQFTRYPPQNMVYSNYPDLSQLLHRERVTNFHPQNLLQLGPPPPQLSDHYRTAIRAAPFTIHSLTLVPTSGYPIRVPVWILDYWQEIRRAMGYQHDWKRVLVWLREVSESRSMVEICDQVMAGLSYFPWNGGNCSVHDMVSLLTDSWLSDFHIDYALTKISHHYHDCHGAEASNSHIFLSVSMLGLIATAYRGGVHHGRAADKTDQLLEVENKIICGHIKSAAGVLHLGNHWTSLVITFKPPRIFYGDSLANPMPPNKASAFQQWIFHMLSRSQHQVEISDICLFPLATTIQKDPNSCGLFALNAIGHHYLQQDSLLLQPDSLSVVQSRMEIALKLLHDGSVSLFFYTDIPFIGL